jgi:hypothetical protein
VLCEQVLKHICGQQSHSGGRSPCLI